MSMSMSTNRAQSQARRGLGAQPERSHVSQAMSAQTVTSLPGVRTLGPLGVEVGLGHIVMVRLSPRDWPAVLLSTVVGWSGARGLAGRHALAGGNGLGRWGGISRAAQGFPLSPLASTG